jgi:NDP-sugar pyrophosphorylase family protein
MYPVAILAGGLAKRLHPITQNLPKSLVTVAGKPFIWWQLHYLRQQQIQQVVLCTGHMGEMIQQVVQHGQEFGLHVQYSPDGPALRGTGGAIKNALPLLGERFFVLYGDSFLPIDFAAVQQAYESDQSAALMTVLRNQDQWDKSNVIFENGALKDYNKHTPRPEMTHIDYGLAILTGKIFESYAGISAFDLADVYEKLAQNKELKGYEVFERFYEIGSHQGLKETEEFLLKRNPL